MVELGNFTLYLALPIAIYAAIAAIVSLIFDNRKFYQSARYAVYVNGALLTITAAAVVTAFLTNRYDIAYVYEYSNIALPSLYKIASLYSGQAGSLLFWGWMLSLYMCVVVFQNRRRNHDLMPYVIFVTMSILTFFVFVMSAAPSLIHFRTNSFGSTLFMGMKSANLAYIFNITLLVCVSIGLITMLIMKLFQKFETDNFKNFLLIGILVVALLFFTNMALTAKQGTDSNPFETIASKDPALQKQLIDNGYDTPPDGRGLNPMLQNYGMLIHPPSLYMGYVGFTIPFAFAIAALITGNLSSAWITSTRKWTIFAWFFLGLGIVLGAQWAYMELGWGGYWAWDPVENASLMPWLVGTAFMHSVMIQEKKNMLKVWNVLLIIFTFALSLFGTFLTRSGVLSSVHSFASGSIGGFFMGLIFIVLPFSIFLMATRLDQLKSKNELDSILSREASFLINNLLLIGATFTVFWGTVFPLIKEALTGSKPTVHAPFYEQVLVPITLVLFLITAICPLIAWRRATRANLIKNFSKPFSSSLLIGLGLAFFIGVGITHQVGFLAGSISLAILAVVATVNKKMVFPVSIVITLGAALYFALNFSGSTRFILPALLLAALGGSLGMFSKNKDNSFGSGMIVGSVSGLVLLFANLKIDHPWALTAYVLLAFMFTTIVLEFYRGTKIRFNNKRERLGQSGFSLSDIPNVIKAFGTLIWKNKRRYGGYIIHTGIVVMFIGITASNTWVTSKDATLKEGESTTIGNYVLQYKTLTVKNTKIKQSNAAFLDVWSANDNGAPNYIGLVSSEKNYYNSMWEKDPQTATEVGLYWNLKEDLYIILQGFDAKKKLASFKIFINPLMVWIWIGGFIICFGTAIVMWPDAKEKKRLIAKYSTSV